MTTPNYTYIPVCPETQQTMTHQEIYYSGGVCVKCGHDSRGTITHFKKIIGWWEQPTLLKRLLGFRAKFHRKPEPDA
jgi:hypothetical protein